MKKKENIFQLLSQKPWEPSQAKIDNEHDGATLALSKAKALLIFLPNIILLSF
jgi:hypothetical protein